MERLTSVQIVLVGIMVPTLLSLGLAIPSAFAFGENVDINNDGVPDVVAEGDFVTGSGAGTQQGQPGDSFMVLLRNDNPDYNVDGDVIVIGPNGEVLFSDTYGGLGTGMQYLSPPIEATIPGKYDVQYGPCLIDRVTGDPIQCVTFKAKTGPLEAALFVVPESPIGMIALIGSSLAALGAFIILKWNRSTGSTGKPSRSAHGLGI